MPYNSLYFVIPSEVAEATESRDLHFGERESQPYCNFAYSSFACL